MEQPSLGPHQSFRGINAANLCMEKLFALCHSRGGRPRNVAFNDEKRVGNAPAPVIEAVLPKQSRISVRISRIPHSSSEKAVLVPFRTKFDHSSTVHREQSPPQPATFRQWEPRIPRLKRSFASGRTTTFQQLSWVFLALPLKLKRTP